MSHRISECGKLAQKEYKTRHEWVGKMIYWELYKKFKFNERKKSLLEYETQKILCDSERKTDHLRPDLVIDNNNKKKRTNKIVGFAV